MVPRLAREHAVEAAQQAGCSRERGWTDGDSALPSSCLHTGAGLFGGGLPHGALDLIDVADDRAASSGDGRN